MGAARMLAQCIGGVNNTQKQSLLLATLQHNTRHHTKQLRYTCKLHESP